MILTGRCGQDCASARRGSRTGAAKALMSKRRPIQLLCFFISLPHFITIVSERTTHLKARQNPIEGSSLFAMKNGHCSKTSGFAGKVQHHGMPR
jgi:hypothetical protein